MGKKRHTLYMVSKIIDPSFCVIKYGRKAEVEPNELLTKKYNRVWDCGSAILEAV